MLMFNWMVSTSMNNKLNCPVIFYLEAEVAVNAALPKPANKVSDFDNPSELIKQAQKELVFNNTANKEENKAKETKGMLLHASTVKPLYNGCLFTKFRKFCLRMTVVEKIISSWFPFLQLS